MNRRSFLKMAGVGAAALALGQALPAGASPAIPNDPQTRILEVFSYGEWRRIPWADLKKGMIFRLREMDGTLVDAGTGHEVCVAMGDAYLTEKGAYGVGGEPFTLVGLSHPLAPCVRVLDSEGRVLGRVYRVHTDVEIALCRTSVEDIYELHQESSLDVNTLLDILPPLRPVRFHHIELNLDPLQRMGVG